MDNFERKIFGAVAPRRAPIKPIGQGAIGRPPPAKHGKKVVFVTHYQQAAKEEANKYEEKGVRTEIGREKDDEGKIVFVVYIIE